MWRQSTRLCALAASIYAVICRYPRIVLAKLMHQTELLKFSGGTRFICFLAFSCIQPSAQQARHYLNIACLAFLALVVSRNGNPTAQIQDALHCRGASAVQQQVDAALDVGFCSVDWLRATLPIWQFDKCGTAGEEAHCA